MHLNESGVRGERIRRRHASRVTGRAGGLADDEGFAQKLRPDDKDEPENPPR